ncbi:hypothetical protein [Micromonospora sp. NPDC049662]|uniref:golvesin C-terminal-like domain-containing protein n=1 Tax=Micromonospora sp. NPDC049662 TaxID=3155397 RepID=UPI00341B53B7
MSTSPPRPALPRGLSPGAARRAVTAALAAAALVASGLVALPAPAAAAPDPPPKDVAVTAVPPGQRDSTLKQGWRTSQDRAWTLSGDMTGLHVLVASAASGYSWTTAATLSEPGLETDQWIGNGCLTESGRRLVVTYAPRAYTNKPDLFDRGAFVAVVDLKNQSVRKVAAHASLAYFSPGCGTGENVVLSTFTGGDTGSGKTRLTQLDAATGSVAPPIQVAGQLTSALPVAGRIIAADNGALVKVDGKGRRSAVARTTGVPFRLAANGDGVVYMDADSKAGRVKRTVVRSGATATLAEGGTTDMNVVKGAGGRVGITGTPGRTHKLPTGVAKLDATVQAEMSSQGDLLLDDIKWTTDPRAAQATDDRRGRSLVMKAKVPATGRSVNFAVAPTTPTSGDAGARANPRTPGRAPSTPGATTLATPLHDPVDTAAWCAIPRNDVRVQVYQPRAREIEWVVDMAVQDSLILNRGNNFNQSGLPGYNVAQWFPMRPLDGGGHVPAQIMLGILAQESNLWQASPHVLPGEFGNPLVGNYYGLDIYDADTSDDWAIRWDKSDCGYGVGQVTDGMRKPGFQKPNEVPLPYNQQLAIAVDFTANISQSLRILQDKWNQVHAYNMKVNGGDPQYIENWFFAVWAYNTGFYAPQGSTDEPWGVGWANNPANPRYPANRKAFLEETYDDARHPSQWPYPEKIMGWAGHPLNAIEKPDTYTDGYRYAWWSTNDGRARVKPHLQTFCDQSNDCYYGNNLPPTAPDVIDEPAGPCHHVNVIGERDLKCWYNRSADWKPGCLDCGNAAIRYDPGWEYPAAGVSYLPKCGTELPANALVVDDVINEVVSPRRDEAGWLCTRRTNSGTFTHGFAGETQNGTLQYPGKIDLHQVGGGYGAHYWFTHTREPGSNLYVSGTWTLDRTVNGWMRVMVHIPDHLGTTQQAAYKITTKNGVVKTRMVQQRGYANRWVALGVFEFNNVPTVELTNTVSDLTPEELAQLRDDVPASGQGDLALGRPQENVAFDAAAFIPLPGKPQHQVVALGDSFSSGEGASPVNGSDYYRESDNNSNNAYRNGCHRSKNAWSRKAVLPGSSTPIGLRADITSQQHDVNMDYHLIACSGAETENILPLRTVSNEPRNADGQRGMGQYLEASQLDKGYLDENTTLVTISIGGNDARFGPVVKECLVMAGPLDCFKAKLSGETDTVDVSTRRRIADAVPRSNTKVLEEIHRKAPNAKIMLMGYPKLVEIGGDPLCALKLVLSDEERVWLTEMSVLLRDEQLDVVHDFNTAHGATIAYYSDPIDEFAGKAVCGSPAGIHGVVTDKSPGDTPDGPTSTQSFHPNSPTGVSLFAQSMNFTVAQMYP